MDRRSFFKMLAGAAALPIVAKLPGPAKAVVERVGALATVRIKAGEIISVVITSGGSGYTSVPLFTLPPVASVTFPPEGYVSDPALSGDGIVIRD